ncbi:glycoside hydrolase family 43 protein [Tropicibacter oceani]|uniref:Glycoside hydrolase family 43 protein n=1 Tax=Tropicibacter oceani TaxID=3058420 RepID=A0ABY8QNF9_9RHOB|nr:glycoside hydrolase family 43 protein [Tropicibacter oceani]WGW05571.1 glycoside hydrolase family 43 protein [Tropicibacter oceani]
MIRNPILPGFNPDPSICRAGDEYFIATSTFEWYPGVQIHRSRDLADWTLACRPLTRASQLDMRGNPDSCGIWAPCLSHADGRFWLVYTDVKRYDGNFKDAHNYIVWADAIEGPWSDPVYVNSSGFDPSLFHDDDGRKYFINMQWNHRSQSIGGSPKTPAFDGILCQEWDPQQGLIGPVRNIFPGTALGLVEAPHLYKRNGWYYLTTAEGGTSYDHAVTMARSRDVWGPYALHPDTHLMTAKDAPDSALQRVGHGQIVETPEGETYHTFLCSRPIDEMGARVGRGYSPLGRETGIERCVWRDDWLYLEAGGQVPRVEVPCAGETLPAPGVSRVFTDASLPPEFQWLRTPEPDRIFQLTGSALRLFGRESIGSWFEQALVARRQEHLAYRAETTLAEFSPTTYQQNAGLVTYYNRFKFHFLTVTREPGLGRALSILSCPGDFPDGRLQFPAQPIAIGDGPIDLAVQTDHARQQFYWRQGGDWQAFGPELNAAVLSDEGGRGAHGSFTGNFVGMAGFDLTGQGRAADFTRFDYQPGAL